MTPLERTRQYADDVLAGREIAGPHVRNACKRLLHDLEHAHERGLWFDEEAAGRAMWFFENVLQLPAEGQFDGKPFDLHPSQAFKIGNIFGWKREDGTRRFRRAYIEEGKGNGKALCTATKIPTPSGWTTMGALVDGDSIYGADGQVCKVVKAHPVSDDRDCYAIRFDDVETIIASDEHLWRVDGRIIDTLTLAVGDDVGGFTVSSIAKVDAVPVRCITVDSHDSMFLCGRSMIPTHNSPMAGGIALMGLCGDGESGSQVYAIASHKDQAGILFRDAVSMVKASPTLKKRLNFSGGEGREYNIAHHASASFFRPASRDVGKTGSGYRPYFVLADEVHEMSDGKIISMMENGFKFRRSPLLFMITNSGSDRNSIAWHQHEHAIKVAAGHNEAVLDPTFIGEPIDDTTFSFVCSLDENDDPLSDPSCWKKANPMLGITITEEWLAAQVKRAKQLPSDLNEVLRLNFCVWTDADSAWMSRQVIEPLLHDFEISEHHGKRISIGLDLSQSRDITATGNVVKTGDIEVWAKDKAGRDIKVSKPTFDIWIEAWTPGDTMQAREERDKLPYTVWSKQGHIHSPSGENISYLHVAQTLVEYSQDYDIAMVAYDRYAFRRFEEDADTVGLSVNFVEHPQGGTKKGKPTEEMEDAAKKSGRVAEGLWFPSSLRMLEDAMLEGRVRFKHNPVLISAIMSAVVEQDKWDNKWLSKQKSVNKIDAIVAVVMAFGAANAMQTEKKKLQLFMVG